MNKCIHDVYISERLGDVSYSDSCSICQSLFPELDYHYGLVMDTSVVSPRTMMGAYELWRSNKSTFTYEKLFYAVRRFVRSIATGRIGLIHGVPTWDDLVENIASDCILNIDSYDVNKSAFSTWLKECTNHAITKWLSRVVGWEEDSIDDEKHPVDVLDCRAGLDEKLLLKEVKALLSDYELKLFEMKAEGLSFEEIGLVLDRSDSSVQERYENLKLKIRNLDVAPATNL